MDPNSSRDGRRKTKMITDSKAVALDAAVDVLLIMYDISSVTPAKPLRWLRGDIRKISDSESEAMFALEFWLFRDPKEKILVVVEIQKQAFGYWQPTQVGVANLSDFKSKNLIWNYKPGESKPTLVKE